MKIIIKRIAAAIPVLFIVSIMVFLMLQLLPGSGNSYFRTGSNT